MVTQKQRAEDTRARLADAFRSIALEQGFEAATTQAVLDRTGLSKGALYHHFRSKAELAEAVYRAESQAVITESIRTVGSGISPIMRLKAICAAWLREVSKPDVRRILFEIGPSLLGAKRVAEIENSLSLRLLTELLNEASDTREISIAAPSLAARLINAYVGEVALQDQADRNLASQSIGPVIDAVLQSLNH